MPSVRKSKSRTTAALSILKGFRKQTRPPTTSTSTIELLVAIEKNAALLRIGNRFDNKLGNAFMKVSTVMPAKYSVNFNLNEINFIRGCKLCMV